MKKTDEIELERLELLIQSKSFVELNREEREWIGKWINSPDEYENLRSSEIEIRQYFLNTKVADPDSETLIHLTKHLRMTKSRQSSGLSWLLKPSFGAVLMSVLFGCLGWWIGQSTNEKSQQQTFNPIIVHDTIYVASKPDTIYTEKVVYKDRPVILTRNLGTTDVNKSIEKNGINMKEKEELEKLLVSGTE
jgi:hypothetical protein